MNSSSKGMCGVRACQQYGYFDRVTATGPVVSYCKPHFRAAVTVFGIHKPKDIEDEE